MAHLAHWRRITPLAALLTLLLWGGPTAAAQSDIDEAVAAVVRIRGCNVAGCNVGLGSGAIIHPSGIILTANHVTLTNPNDPMSSRHNDFVIEITEDARIGPEARYRAQLLAFDSAKDLALLRIYHDERTGASIEPTSGLELPALPLADVEGVRLGETLHVLGYPLVGGNNINYTDPSLSGFDDNNTLLKVTAALGEGNSGGPALVERNGRLEIAGVVIRRRGETSAVSLMRTVDQLHSMTWPRDAHRAWVDNVVVVPSPNAPGADLQISADLHLLDFVGEDGMLLAYGFTRARQPLRVSPPSGAARQLVFAQSFTASHSMQAQTQSVAVSLDGIDIDPNETLWRLVLWDVENQRVLWVSSGWHPVTTQPAEMPATPATPTTEVALATETPAATATNTPTPDLVATAVAATVEALAAVPTPTPTSPPPTATETATNPPPPTATVTPSHTPTASPTSTATEPPPPTVTPTVTPPPTHTPPAVTGSRRSTENGYFAIYHSESIVLDGSFDDWPGALVPLRAVPHGASSWWGEEDLSAQGQVAWSHAGLLVAITVTDDVYQMAPQSARNMWNGDCIELHFDRDLEADFHHESWSRDDYNLMIAFGHNRDEIIGYQYAPSLPYPDSTVSGIEGYVSALSDGYVVELRIPWRVFGLDGPPERYTTYGFALSVHDTDGSGTLDTIVSSSASRRAAHIPQQWGTAVFVE